MADEITDDVTRPQHYITKYRGKRDSVAAGRFHEAGPCFIYFAVPNFNMARSCRACFFLFLAMVWLGPSRTMAEDDEDDYHLGTTGLPTHTAVDDLQDLTSLRTTEYLTDGVTVHDDHTKTLEPCNDTQKTNRPLSRAVGQLSYKATTEDQTEEVADEDDGVTVTMLPTTMDYNGHETATGASTLLDHKDLTPDVPMSSTTETVVEDLGRDSYDFFTSVTRPNYLKTTRAPVRYFGQLSFRTTMDHLPEDHVETGGTDTTPFASTDHYEASGTQSNTEASATPVDGELEESTVTGHGTVTEGFDQSTVPMTTPRKPAGRGSCKTTTTAKPPQYYGRLSRRSTVDPRPDDHYETLGTETTPGVTTDLDGAVPTDGRTGASVTPLDAEVELATMTGHSTMTEHVHHSTTVPFTTYYKVSARESYDDHMQETTRPPVQYGRLYYRTTMDTRLDDHEERHGTETTPQMTTRQDETLRTDGRTVFSVTPLDTEDEAATMTGNPTATDADQSTVPPTSHHKATYGGQTNKTTTTTKTPDRYFGRLSYHTTEDSISDDHVEDGTETTTGLTPDQEEVKTEGYTGASATPLVAEEELATATGYSTGHSTGMEDADQSVVPSTTIYYKPAGRDTYDKMYTTTTQKPVRYYGRLSYRTTLDSQPDDHYDHHMTETTPGFTTDIEEATVSKMSFEPSVTPLDSHVQESTVTGTGHSTTTDDDQTTIFQSTVDTAAGRDSYDDLPPYKTTTKPPAMPYARKMYETTMNTESGDFEDHFSHSTTDFTVPTERASQTELNTEVTQTVSQFQDDASTLSTDFTSTPGQRDARVTFTSTGASDLPEIQDSYVDKTTTLKYKRKTAPVKYYRMYQQSTMPPEAYYGRDSGHDATTDSATPNLLQTIGTDSSTLSGSTPEDEVETFPTVTVMSTIKEVQDSTDFTQTTYQTEEYPVHYGRHYGTTGHRPRNSTTTTKPPVRYYAQLSKTTMVPETEDDHARDYDGTTITSATPDGTEPTLPPSHSTPAAEEFTAHDEDRTQTFAATPTFSQQHPAIGIAYTTKEPNPLYSTVGYKTKAVPVVYRQRKFYQSTIVPDYREGTNDMVDSTTTMYPSDDRTDFQHSTLNTGSSGDSFRAVSSATATLGASSTEGYYEEDHGQFHGTTKIPIRKKARVTLHQYKRRTTEVPQDLGREVHLERSGRWSTLATGYTPEEWHPEFTVTDATTSVEDVEDSAITSKTPVSNEENASTAVPTGAKPCRLHGTRPEDAKDPCNDTTKVPLPESRESTEEGSPSTLEPDATVTAMEYNTEKSSRQYHRESTVGLHARQAKDSTRDHVTDFTLSTEEEPVFPESDSTVHSSMDYPNYYGYF